MGKTSNELIRKSELLADKSTEIAISIFDALNERKIGIEEAKEKFFTAHTELLEDDSRGLTLIELLWQLFLFTWQQKEEIEQNSSRH